MLSAPLLQSLGIEHLLAAAHRDIDPLTSTPLELELLKRLEHAQEQIAELMQDRAPLEALADEYGPGFARKLHLVATAHPANLDEQAAMLRELRDQGLDHADQLRERLDLARRFLSLAQDAGDIFDQLFILVTLAQKE